MGLIGRLLIAAMMWVTGLACALAQSPVGADTSSAPAAIRPAPPPAPAAAPAVASPGNCNSEIAGARLGPPSSYVVELDPDTLWRPRGTEVRFTIGSTTGTAPQVKRVLVCFRWEPEHAQAAQPGYTSSPLVRSVPNADGLIEYGALVPGLPAPSRHGSGADHVGAVAYTAVDTVPVADMQILVELSDDSWFAVVLPVGVTSVHTALAILVVCLLIASVILWRSAPSELLAGAKGWNLDNVSRHVLAVISTCNGVASLSQFQIMLWTFVVGGAAIYVMPLSGNLIAISTGTLSLLGIAGGTTVLARVAPMRVGNSGTPPPPAGPGTTDEDALEAELAVEDAKPLVAQAPRWSQILIQDAADPEIDVTRVQMLIFTLITAAFVTIKVAVSYSIPEIPENFLVLMGISNGVYLAGRQIPSTPKGRTP